MSKVIKFDLSEDTLIKLAEQKLNNKQYISSLRYLNKYCSMYQPNDYVYSLFGEVYDDINLYPSSVNYWFNYLDYVYDENYPDDIAIAYESLAGCYFNMGDDTKSAYFYNKLFNLDPSIVFENKDEVLKMFSKPKKSAFRVVYPPEKADFSDEIQQGLDFLKENDFKNALNTFKKVLEGSKQYIQALNLSAVAYLLLNKSTDAEKCCRKILNLNSKNIEAICTLSTSLNEQGKKDEAQEVIQRLCFIEPKSAEETYKIATVFCENEMHERAYNTLMKVEEDVSYDDTILYFKAVSAYKCGKITEAINTFEKILDIYPKAGVVRYYLQKLKNRQQINISYIYKIDTETREDRIKSLYSIVNCKKKEIDSLCENIDVDDYLNWAFDELNGQDFDLQLLSVNVAVKLKKSKFIKDKLLNIFYQDMLKIEILRLLCLQNKNLEIGVVICGMYYRLRLIKLEIGVKARNAFVLAYANCFSKFALLDQNYGQKFNDSAQDIYYTLLKSDALSLAENTPALACAIFMHADLQDKNFGLNPKVIKKTMKQFQADVDAVLQILSLAEEKS